MTIAQAREMCVKVRDAGQKVFGDLTAAEEGQYEPFRKILSGDKLNLYNDRLKKYKLYGLAGKVLKTPEDYRDSNVWCTTGVDREVLFPCGVLTAGTSKAWPKSAQLKAEPAAATKRPPQHFASWECGGNLDLGGFATLMRGKFFDL